MEREGGRGSTTINGNFSLIKEKLHMHLAHTNWNQSRQKLYHPSYLWGMDHHRGYIVLLLKSGLLDTEVDSCHRVQTDRLGE